MKTFSDIQKIIDDEFELFITEVFQKGYSQLRYFYWEESFIEKAANMSFQFYKLSTDVKRQINEIGEQYFQVNDVSVFFAIDKHSDRFNLYLKNIGHIYGKKNKGTKQQNEYIKEFVLWDIMRQLDTISSETVLLQRNNFFISYLKYLYEQEQLPNISIFSDYKKFIDTKQGSDLLNELADLEINKSVLNSELKNKIKSLYILTSLESKLHFIFSKKGTGKKEELRELLEIMGQEGRDLLYRGQVNSFWQIAPGITRNKNFELHEKEMFYEVLSLKPDAFVSDKSIYERWITMQHYGMPTRLLDVTRNPLMAIYFACTDGNNKMNAYDGLICVFKPDPQNFLHFEDQKLSYFKYLYQNNSNEQAASIENIKDFIDSICFIRGLAKNQRISNQSGDFIYIGRDSDNITELNNLTEKEIIIDAEAKETLIEELATLNIHAGTVYPDLSHISEYIRQKYLKIKPTDDELAMQKFRELNKFALVQRKKSDEDMKNWIDHRINNPINIDPMLFEMLPDMNVLKDKVLNQANQLDDMIADFCRKNNLKEDETIRFVKDIIFGVQNINSIDILKLCKIRIPLKQMADKRKEISNNLKSFILDVISAN